MSCTHTHQGFLRSIWGRFRDRHAIVTPPLSLSLYLSHLWFSGATLRDVAVPGVRLGKAPWDWSAPLLGEPTLDGVRSGLCGSSRVAWPTRSLALFWHHSRLGGTLAFPGIRLCPPSVLPGCSWLPWSSVGDQLLLWEAGLHGNPYLSAVWKSVVWIIVN